MQHKVHKIFPFGHQYYLTVIFLLQNFSDEIIQKSHLGKKKGCQKIKKYIVDARHKVVNEETPT